MSYGGPLMDGLPPSALPLFQSVSKGVDHDSFLCKVLVVGRGRSVNIALLIAYRDLRKGQLEPWEDERTLACALQTRYRRVISLTGP